MGDSSKSNYGQLSEKLNEIVYKLQSADTDIEEAIKLHEEGTKIIVELEKYLKDAENKIKKVSK